MYLIGLDNGGTSTKAAVFDVNGNEVATAGRHTKLITPKPGYTERDMEELWLANCACVREALEKAGIDGKDVLGIAVCGHGKGMYAWGKDNKPAYNGIISTDNRAWQYTKKWYEDGTYQALHPQLCQEFMACQQTALLAWFKDHLPQVYHNIQYVFSVKDYIRFRLTGEAFCEATDISGSGLMDVKNARFDRSILEKLGIGEAFDMLAPIRYSYDLCGKINAQAAKLTGLPEGTPVAGGMFDIDACAVAADITTNKNMVPFDSRSPFQTSGLRFGTPAITTRGLKEDKMDYIVGLIDRVLHDPENEANIAAVRKDVNALMADYPLFAW